MSSQGSRLSLILIGLVAAMLLQPANIRASDNPRSVSAIAVDPTDPLTIYASTTGGLYKTTDGGKEWMVITSALQGAHTLLIDPTMPSTLFARVGPRDILRSVDAGSTWAAIGVSYWWDPRLAIDSQSGIQYLPPDRARTSRRTCVGFLGSQRRRATTAASVGPGLTRVWLRHCSPGA
jgi:hypothetical protein